MSIGLVRSMNPSTPASILSIHAIKWPRPLRQPSSIHLMGKEGGFLQNFKKSKTFKPPRAPKAVTQVTQHQKQKTTLLIIFSLKNQKIRDR